MSVPVSDLRVMQDGFRLSPQEMWEMHDFVEGKGGYFNKESLAEHDPKRTSLIALARTEDGKLWIRDGLHRVAIVKMSYRDLRDDECVMEDIPYAKFLEINTDKGWYTPFDPREEVRKADFHDFKDKVQRILEKGQDPTEYIKSHRDAYCVPRTPWHDLRAYCHALFIEWWELHKQKGAVA